jgi:hypothetical protein
MVARVGESFPGCSLRELHDPLGWKPKRSVRSAFFEADLVDGSGSGKWKRIWSLRAIILFAG